MAQPTIKGRPWFLWLWVMTLVLSLGCETQTPEDPILAFTPVKMMTLREVKQELGEPDLLQEVKDESKSFPEYTISTVRVAYGPFGAFDAAKGDVTRYRLELIFEKRQASPEALLRVLEFQKTLNHSEDEKRRESEANQIMLYGEPALESWERNEPNLSERK